MLPVPLRVALTIGPSGHGGIATYARELARALARRTDIALVTVGTAAARAELDIPPAVLADRGVEHIEVAAGRLGGQLGVLTMRRRLVEAGVDVFHGTRQLVPLRSPVPTVLTFHDDFAITRRGDYDLLKRLLMPAAYRGALRRAGAVVTLSSAMARVAAGYVRDGVPIVDAGAAAPTTLTEARIVAPTMTLPARYALAVGDCSPRKNVESLLDAWGGVFAATGLRLVVAGGRGASPALRARLAAGHDRMLVAEPSWGELAHLYARAAIVVEPSAAEGFGFAQVEAAHFGRVFLPLHGVADVVGAVGEALGSAASGGRPDHGRASGWDAVADRTVAVYLAAAGR